MGRLTDIYQRAKSLLARPERDTEATDAVKHDRFDAALFKELMDAAPALQDLVEDLGINFDHSEDLVRDTLMQFWQGDPQVRPLNEMADSHLVHHGVATDVQQSESLKSARTYTQHDKYGAAMATLGVGEQVRAYAKKHGDRLKEAQEEAERAKEEQEAAEKALQEALAGAFPNGAPGDDEGEGGEPGDPDGDGGGQGMLTLEQAIAKAEAAAQAAQDAQDALQQEAQQAKNDLRSPVQSAMQEAKEELEDEAELFASWGIEPGVVKNMPFNERRDLAATLGQSKIHKFLDLVGRFKLMAAAQRVRKVEYGRDQVVGTELSGDLSRVVMTELNALAMGDDELGELMELDFYRRWFEDQLLSREFEGQEKVGKGAIICVWDESGSMGAADSKCLRCGSKNLKQPDYYDDDQTRHCLEPKCGGAAATREAWAKALALALLDTARSQKRDFVGIGFSSARDQVVYRFPKGRAEMPDVLRMVEHFFGGGTNFEKPMGMAAKILEEEFNESGRAKGDIVFVTDDDCHVTPDWLSDFIALKERLDFRVFGIAVGMNRAGGTLEALSDNVRSVNDFADTDQARDIFQVV